jgi:peroxiredoxin
MTDYAHLPADLPEPQDDGAAAHLTGARLPDVTLGSTAGELVHLGSLAGRWVIYVYPRTGRPGEPSPDGWDAIPGARGCTPQSCGFRDHHAELRALGVGVHGLSAQTGDEQREARDRLHLPFELLSDSTMRLAATMGLPTFTVAGMELYRRITLVIRDAVVEKVFYPVFPPDGNAADVTAWLREDGSRNAEGAAAPA